jgi:hypothetical protein
MTGASRARVSHHHDHLPTPATRLRVRSSRADTDDVVTIAVDNRR